MIIFRYLFKEVMTTTLAVSLVLLVIIMSGRFIKYLAQAAEGKLAADALFSLILYRVPGFLELIIPLGLFLGILLAYGRLYLENEMAVLNASGFSNHRLQLFTLGSAGVCALLILLIAVWLTPWSSYKFEEVLDRQDALTEFDTLSPGRFQQDASGDRVTYTEELVQGRTLLQNIYIFDRTQGDNQVELSVTAAESGRQFYDETARSRILLLENGRRYQGVPAQADYQVLDFEQYGVKMDREVVARRVNSIRLLPTAELFGQTSPQAQTQLHWRLSLPMLCLTVSIMAVALCRANPRQGRFARILPAILLYIGYISILSQLRTDLESGELQQVASLWAVHLAFLALALMMHFWGGILMQRVNRAIGLVWRLLPGRAS